MHELVRRAAPGFALAGVALTSVWMLDPALRGGEATEQAAPVAPEASGPATPDAPVAERVAPVEPHTPAAASDCSTATTTETGDEAWTRWGPVQVQMTFAADGTVCAVQAVAYPDDDSHSARLNATAIPSLDEQAAAGGIAFDAVSGATYTSEAYRESMQSILDRR
jgi:uncharacterized protein with FMN-binding domain